MEGVGSVRTGLFLTPQAGLEASATSLDELMDAVASYSKPICTPRPTSELRRLHLAKEEAYGSSTSSVTPAEEWRYQRQPMV